MTTPRTTRIRTRTLVPTAFAAAVLLATGASAQTASDAAASATVAPATNMGPGREGTADVESILLTLSSQATEIRQNLMEGGEMGEDGLMATERAREIATQAIEATAILGNPGDTQVTTTRMSEMDMAAAQFVRLEEALSARIAAIQAGDATAANKARLAALDAINELPDRIQFGGDAAPSDNVTAAPGGAEPTIQQ